MILLSLVQIYGYAIAPSLIRAITNTEMSGHGPLKQIIIGVIIGNSVSHPKNFAVGVYNFAIASKNILTNRQVNNNATGQQLIVGSVVTTLVGVFVCTSLKKYAATLISSVSNAAMPNKSVLGLPGADSEQVLAIIDQKVTMAFAKARENAIATATPQRAAAITTQQLVVLSGVTISLSRIAVAVTSIFIIRSQSKSSSQAQNTSNYENND